MTVLSLVLVLLLFLKPRPREVFPLPWPRHASYGAVSTLIVSAASILVIELTRLVPSTLIATLDSVQHVAVTPEPTNQPEKPDPGRNEPRGTARRPRRVPGGHWAARGGRPVAKPPPAYPSALAGRASPSRRIREYAKKMFGYPCRATKTFPFICSAALPNLVH